MTLAIGIGLLGACGGAAPPAPATGETPPAKPTAEDPPAKPTTSTPEPDEPPTKEPVAEAEYRCTSDADCVSSCVEEDNCCPNPCGCDVVRHKDEHQAVVRANEKYCSTVDAKCPDVGACDPNFEYATPRCVDGACTAELPASRRKDGAG